MKVLTATLLLTSSVMLQAQQGNLPPLTMPQLAMTQAPAGQVPLPALQLEQSTLPQLNSASDFKIIEPTDLRGLLSLLAQHNGLNLAMAPDISGQVEKLDLHRVTLKQALDVIVVQRGFEYQIEDGLLKVSRPQMKTRTFSFDYVQTARTLGRSMSASVSASAGTGGSVGGAGGGGGGSTSLSGSETTNLLKDVQDRLAELKSTTPGARLQMVPMLGTIIAVDLPANLDAMQHLVDVLQAAANRQVIIEAQLVEVMLNKDFKTGINWGLVSKALNATQTLSPQGTFELALNAGNLNVFLNALSKQGKVNIRSAPQIQTLNGQPAAVRLGTQEPIFIETRERDRTTGAVISTSETISTINEGVVLDVTPFISETGFVTMNIHPTVSERTGEKTSAQGNTAPITNVQETDTVIRVAHNETAAIAGLITDRMIHEKNNVPLLSSIPLFGNLFKSTSTEVQKTDLIILLTPRVITPASSAEYARRRIESQDKFGQEGR